MPDVGPQDPPGQDHAARAEALIHLVTTWYSLTWLVVLFAATFGCCGGMVWLKRRERNPPSQNVQLLVYVTAQVTSAVIGTSASKMFPLASGAFLGSLFVIAVIFAAINVVSLILAAKTVNQALFVPLQARRPPPRPMRAR